MIIKMTSEASAQLIQILEKTVSPDKNELEAAQNYLEQAAQSNLPEFVKTLSDILHHGGNSPVARMAAGLQLKNTLTSKDLLIKTQYQQRWLAFPEDVRLYIKKNIVGALGTENNRPSSAAQCVAYVAVAELPVGQWPDLITVLVNNIISNGSTEMMKEATLEAIGYICQDIEQDVLISQSNQILTAIIHGMRLNEPSNHVRLAATTALFNSLEFTRSNFDKESERNYIMEVVCEATQSPDTQVKVAALQCLVKIMSLYYHYMEPYMGPALFPITLEAMKSDIDEVALQGIEFWSNVSDEEVDLAIEDSEAAEAGRPPQRSSKFYAKGALQFLVPVLMTKLTKQEEFDDEDDWNPSKAAGVCLMLLATCCEDAIVPFVLPFVKENIKSTNWRYRDAALMAFGSILGGLESTTLRPLVEQAMPTLIELMYDSSVVVRDTAAWTFGRICEIIPEAAINENYLKPLLESLVNGLKAEPRVAANVCWAFTGLAESAYEAVEGNEEGAQPETYCLSEYFDFIIMRLLETTDRADGAQANLRSAAYEALMEMVKNSPGDCYVTVQKTTMIILDRLNQVLQMETQVQSHTDRAQYNDLQSLLCATLQSVLRKVTPEDAPQISDAIMTALLQMFNSNSCKSGGVQEDAIMAVSTLVEVLGERFLKYMDAFKPFLCLGLKNHAEYQVCGSAVGLTGDICRALKTKALPYCDEIMTLLLENLGDNTVHRSVKPQILSVFGDIALSIGPEFKKYLDVVLQTLVQASQAQVDRADFDMVDYLNDLREGIFEAYTGIIQGLKGDAPTPNPDIQLLEPHIPFIINFITLVAYDTDKADSNIGASAGLIGDLCSAFGSKVFALLDVEPVNEVLTLGRRSRVSKTKTLATWATKEMRKLKTANSSWVSLAVGQGMPSTEEPQLQIRKQQQHDGMDLDDLLPQVGEFGLYQKLLLWLVCLPACIPCGFCAFNQLFMADTPDHWCLEPELMELPPERRKLLAIPYDETDNGTFSKCSRYNVNWTQLLLEYDVDELTPNMSWPVSTCVYGWEFDTSVVSSSIVIDYELVCQHDIYPTIGLAALNAGGPVGVYMFGILNDRYGRRLSFFLCLATLIVGNLACAFMPNFWLWAICRVVAGLTIPAIYQIPFIIALELVGPNYRSFVTVMTCLFYTLGLVLLAGITYLVRNWVHLAIVTSLPFLLYYIYWWFLPESPRWLLAKGRLEEASKILETLASVNGKELPDSFKLRLKQRMMLQRTRSEERRLQTGPGVGALFKTPNMRLKTILITLNWFANEMVYVGLSYYGPALGSDQYLSFLLSSLVEIPSYLACWVVMDRWGRRWPLSIAMIVSGISCIITVLLPPEAVTETLVLFLLSKFAISASFLIIYPFTGELYPTQLRGVGIGFSAYISGLGLIIIPFITYLGSDHLVLPLVIMGAVSVVVGLTSLRLPETLHHRLPQTIDEGEEFGKDWSFAECFRCVPLQPSSVNTSYQDLDCEAKDQVELQPQTSLQLSTPDKETALLGRRVPRRLVRQASIMETPLDSSGSMKMTYWF